MTAIGCVHKAAPDIGPSHQHYPKSVAHYWRRYQPHAAKKNYHPETLAEYFLTARSISRNTGSFDQCVNSIALGIMRLASTMGSTTPAKTIARAHRALEDQIGQRPELVRSYRGLLQTFLVDAGPLTEQSWVGISSIAENLAAALCGGTPDSAAGRQFLAWPSTAESVPHSESSDANEIGSNLYRAKIGDAFVDIRLGSIHSVKGQTHLATLILETYFHKHVLESVLPWLLGDRANGNGSQKRERDRLLQMYVAMTRPTHLVCLAMRASSLGTTDVAARNIGRLEERGWHICSVAP